MEKTCTKCGEVKSLDNYHKSLAGVLGTVSKCKNCVKKYTDSYYKKNKKQVAEKKREYYRSNKGCIKSKVKEYRKNNKIKRRELKARYRASKLRATPRWLSERQKEEIFYMYELSGILCSLLKESYHVDHIVPLQGKNVCGLHVPWNLQVILARENLSKKNTHADW